MCRCLEEAGIGPEIPGAGGREDRSSQRSRHGVLFWSDEKVLEQPREYAKYHGIAHFKSLILWYVNFTSIKKEKTGF